MRKSALAESADLEFQKQQIPASATITSLRLLRGQWHIDQISRCWQRQLIRATEL
jgi:hypothetical protein